MRHYYSLYISLKLACDKGLCIDLYQANFKDYTLHITDPLRDPLLTNPS